MLPRGEIVIWFGARRLTLTLWHPPYEGRHRIASGEYPRYVRNVCYEPEESASENRFSDTH